MRFAQLDPDTLLICGHLLLTLMGAAMMVMRPLPGSRSRTIPLWIASLAAAVVPGLLATFDDLPDSPMGELQPPGGVGAIVQIALFLAAALQVLALREVRAGECSVRTLGAIVIATGVVAAIGARRPDLILWPLAVMRALVPVLAWRSLRRVAAEGIGGAIVCVSVVLGAMPGWTMLFGLASHTGLHFVTLLMLVDLLTLFSASLGLLLWHQTNIQAMLRRLAAVDALTGALNRHGLFPRLEAEIARARRHGRPLSVVGCDLDHFKRVNDTYGHDAGDEVLKAFVARAHASLRASDFVGRLGGEEFVIVLPETAQADAVRVVDLMRQVPLKLRAGLPAVTFSAGVATAAEHAPHTSAELLKFADQLLYAAKEKRDCVVAGTLPAPA